MDYENKGSLQLNSSSSSIINLTYFRLFIFFRVATLDLFKRAIFKIFLSNFLKSAMHLNTYLLSCKARLFYPLVIFNKGIQYTYIIS